VQTLAAGLLVAVCALHVAWALLLPRRLRGRVARWLQRQPLPQRLTARLQPRAGCDCGGCDGRPAGKADAGQAVIRLRPRR
jgi:hypothetical protein